MSIEIHDRVNFALMGFQRGKVESMKRIGLNPDTLYFESSMIYRTSPIQDRPNEWPVRQAVFGDKVQLLGRWTNQLEQRIRQFVDPVVQLSTIPLIQPKPRHSAEIVERFNKRSCPQRVRLWCGRERFRLSTNDRLFMPVFKQDSLTGTRSSVDDCVSARVLCIFFQRNRKDYTLSAWPEAVVTKFKSKVRRLFNKSQMTSSFNSFERL